MAQNKPRIGWIGMGRMGYPMAERLLKAGYDVSIWNRTRSKAEPLAKIGGKVVDNLFDLKDVDVLFSIVSTGKDLDQVYFGKNSVTGHGGKAAEDLRRLLDHLGRGIRRDPRPAQPARQRVRRGAGERQCQGDQGRQALRRRLRQRGRLQDGHADAGGDRAAGRLLRGRRRARAHLQDRPQCHARGRDREPDRDHAARQQDGRSAPRVPRRS